MNPPPTLHIDRPIYLLGDHHGYIEYKFSEIDDSGIRDAVILHVGDGEEGISMWHEHFQAIDKACAERNLHYLGIRGNHCDPAFFDGSVDMPNFKLLPDYTRLIVRGKSWLLIGGATSIDRIDRKRGGGWWAKEKFQLRRELATPAEVLVTHSGPTWIGPKAHGYMIELNAQEEREMSGTDLIGDLETERMLHDALFEMVRPKHWYLGHFHTREALTHKGCVTRILDMNELHLHRE